jgi:hypothetical protein
MIEIFLIFAALVATPMLISFPFYVRNIYRDMKEKEAQEIMDRLRGIPRGTDWPGPG